MTTIQATGAMQRRRLGRTDLHLSVVGFGTCQLQMVPEEQAVATLLRGFELGVNWVHADLGYGGVETIVARAIRESGRKDILPVANGWGTVERVEEAYARVCKAYGLDRLELFGLSCIDDDDLILKLDVWGPNGIVARLQQMKREGRIGATWVSTHGEPAYVERLLECGAFDSIMMAWNPLGFHLLSSDARQEGKPREDLVENGRRIFARAAELGVSLLIMKPFAGGLLVPGKAFPPHHRYSRERTPLRATDVLRSILAMPGVTAVLPGTASVEEAQENASSGHAPIGVSPAVEQTIVTTAQQMRTEVCSRCGDCEPTCSKGLPISWLFRDAYLWSYGTEFFEALDRRHYLKLHPDTTLACASCTDQSCVCPQGIEIPTALAEAHAQVLSLRERGLMHTSPAEAETFLRRGHLTARLLVAEVPERLDAGARSVCRIWLENRSDRVWLPQEVHVRAVAGSTPLAEARLRHEVAPGERAFFAFELFAPIRAGETQVDYELVRLDPETFEDHCTWLARKPLVVTAAQPKPTRQAQAAASETVADPEAVAWRELTAAHPWIWTPTRGVTGHETGDSFPVFVDRAEGCRIWDARGREYIDYTMAWGTTVLGYGHPKLQRAVAEAMRAPPLLAFPRASQRDVVRLLLEDFPGVRHVAFGKNGSDVCTLAARLCRVHTGRRVILYSGYHGWGDFWAEQHGFERTGIPDRDPPLIHRFRFNDTAGFLELFERHRDDLAGVMLEPSGPWGGNEVGHEPDADQRFLETLRETTASVGALLVFDEIITGYRYPQGSVQRARNVLPDLTCLGKALASGMPLSALLGRGDVMERSYHRSLYGPTFQAEAWSFAAARATIQVFRSENVGDRVWRHGEALRQGIEAALAAAGITGVVKGPPFRMSLFLAEPDGERRLRQRTLLQQELLRRGIMIYNNGVMVPCLAHDETTLARTVAVFGEALGLVAEATADDSLDRRIVIPLLQDM